MPRKAKTTNFVAEYVPPGHEAISHLPATASMVDILEAIAKWLNCSIVVSNGIWHFIPNGKTASPDFLAARTEAAKLHLRKQRKTKRGTA